MVITSKMILKNNGNNKYSNFTISLDFELRWGVLELPKKYDENILGARKAIPLMLKLFEKYEVKVFWATVGLLFCRDLNDYRKYMPNSIPKYKNSKLNPFLFEPGKSENMDRLHYANSLIKLIKNTSGQEIASHSYSHFIADDPLQTKKNFDDDCKASKKIAKDLFNVDLKTYIFAKNKINEDYFPILYKNGFTRVRVQSNKQDSSKKILHKITRLINTFFPITSVFSKSKIYNYENIKFIYANKFLRPAYSFNLLNSFMIKKIKNEMTQAAKNKLNYHLWWHPHNFGKNINKNLYNLEQILLHYRKLKEEYNFQSLVD